MGIPAPTEPAPAAPIGAPIHAGPASLAPVRARLGQRSVVLVGLMGSGKTTVGRRLAGLLGLPFADADAEIEAAAGMTIPDIFESFGEPHFRRGEERVIARMLDGASGVLATGGGAFMSAATREAIGARGVSVWLRAELETLMRRVRRRGHRPLLKTPDPEATMRALMEARHPVYGLADITVPSGEGSHHLVASAVAAALADHLAAESSP